MENKMREPPHYGYAGEPKPQESQAWMDKVLPVVIGLTFLAIILGIVLCIHPPARAEEIPPATGRATWYSVESCEQESGQHRMANGEKLNDSRYTAASWFYRFGTRLRVTNLENGRSVMVTVCDRGPSRRLVKKGKIIDLSAIAFKAIANLQQGVIRVKVERDA